MNKIVICICICFYILCASSYGGGDVSSASDKNTENYKNPENHKNLQNDKKYITDELKRPKPNFNYIKQIIFKYSYFDINLLRDEIRKAIRLACEFNESEFLHSVLKKCVNNKNIFSSLFYLFDYACDHNDKELFEFIVCNFNCDILNLTDNYNNLLKYAFFYEDFKLINRILKKMFELAEYKDISLYKLDDEIKKQLIYNYTVIYNYTDEIKIDKELFEEILEEILLNTGYEYIVFESIVCIGNVKLIEYIFNDRCCFISVTSVKDFLEKIEAEDMKSCGKFGSFVDYILKEFPVDKANDIVCVLIKKATELEEFELIRDIRYKQAKNLFNKKKPFLFNIDLHPAIDREYIKSELSSRTTNFNGIKNILKPYNSRNNLMLSFGLVFIQELSDIINKHENIDCMSNCMQINNEIRFLLNEYDGEYDYKEILKAVIETFCEDFEKNNFEEMLDKIKKSYVVKDALYLNGLSIKLNNLNKANKVNDIKKDFIAQIENLKIDDFFVIAISGDISLMKLIIDVHKVNNLLITDVFKKLICALPLNDINIDMSIIFLIKRIPEFIDDDNFIQKVEKHNKKNIINVIKIVRCKKLKNEEIEYSKKANKEIEYITKAMDKLLFIIIKSVEADEKLKPLQ